MRTTTLVILSLAAGLSGCGANGDPAPGPAPSTAHSQRTAADLTTTEWAGVIDDLDCAPINEGVEVADRQVADLRGIGIEDVIVSVTCVHHNSAWPYQVVVYDGSSGATAPHRLGVLLDDDEDLLAESVTATGGRVTVHTLGFSADDGLCCPSLKASRTFAWNGSALVRS